MYYDTEYFLNKINRKDSSDRNNTRRKLTKKGLKNYLKARKNEEDIVNAFTELRLKLAECFKLGEISFLTGNGSSIYAGSSDTQKFNLGKYTSKDKYKDIKPELDHISDKDMESALNKVNILYEQKKIVGDNDKAEKYGDLIAEIKQDLIGNFVNSINYAKLTDHEILFRKLRTFGALDKVNIFTANYDLAFEYALDQLGIEYSNGFTGFITRKFSTRALERYRGLILDKVHGSINWITDPDDNTIREIQPQFECNDKQEIKLKSGRNVEHVLIYPTSNKLYQTYSTPYSELMRFMLDRFESRSNVIIVVGYKYGDDHINEILEKALANPKNVFFFFDFDEGNKQPFVQEIRRLAKQLPNVNLLVGSVLADFVNIVRYMIPATPEKTDGEKIVELLQKVAQNGSNSWNN